MGYTATDLDILVSEFARALRRGMRVERILLFGSRARRDAGEESDIDLLVVSPDFGRDALTDMVLLRECLPSHEIDIDTIARTPGTDPRATIRLLFAHPPSPPHRPVQGCFVSAP